MGAAKIEADLAGPLVRRAATIMHGGKIAVSDRARNPAVGDHAVAVVRREDLVDAAGLAAERKDLLGIVAEPEVYPGMGRRALPAEGEADAVDAHTDDVRRRRDAADDAVPPQHIARRSGNDRHDDGKQAENDRP